MIAVESVRAVVGFSCGALRHHRNSVYTAVMTTTTSSSTVVRCFLQMTDCLPSDQVPILLPLVSMMMMMMMMMMMVVVVI